LADTCSLVGVRDELGGRKVKRRKRNTSTPHPSFSDVRSTQRGNTAPKTPPAKREQRKTKNKETFLKNKKGKDEKRLTRKRWRKKKSKNVGPVRDTWTGAMPAKGSDSQKLREKCETARRRENADVSY